MRSYHWDCLKTSIEKWNENQWFVYITPLLRCTQTVTDLAVTRFFFVKKRHMGYADFKKKKKKKKKERLRYNSNLGVCKRKHWNQKTAYAEVRVYTVFTLLEVVNYLSHLRHLQKSTFMQAFSVVSTKLCNNSICIVPYV